MRHALVIGLLLGCVVGGVSAISYAQSEPIVIIGNPEIADTIQKEDIKQIFLGKKTRWENDTKIVFVLLNDELTYSAFLKEYVGKTIFQYTNYWKQQVFTGQGRMPKAVKTSEEMIEYIAGTAGAIGFAAPQNITGNAIKILTVQN